MFNEEWGFLIEGATETIKNEAKEQKGGFRSMLLGTLTSSISGNVLAWKGVMKVGEEVIRACQNVM